jgi:hypothetical protein
MTTAVVICLGVVALASVVQAIVAVMLLREGQRVFERVTRMEADVRRELGPLVGRLSGIADDLAAVSTVARRMEARLEATVATVQKASAIVAGPLGALVPLWGVFRGMRRGVRAYRALRSGRKALGA